MMLGTTNIKKKMLLLHLVGCVYYYISDAGQRSKKHQIFFL